MLFNSGEEVFDVFEAYRDTDRTRCDTAGALSFFRKLLMCRRSGVNEEGLGVADVSQVGEDVRIVDEFTGSCIAVF